MYEKEIKKVRLAVMNGLLASSKNLVSTKIRNNRPIAVIRDNCLQVVPACNL
ncbi:MAG: hypothetical protein LBU51_05220 [Bacteroidales bacterium]|jgi:hypothetical protein|nr:hypothetical protein [Bacteroidales bacterium]